MQNVPPLQQRRALVYVVLAVVAPLPPFRSYMAPTGVRYSARLAVWRTPKVVWPVGPRVQLMAPAFALA